MERIQNKNIATHQFLAPLDNAYQQPKVEEISKNMAVNVGQMYTPQNFHTEKLT